MGNPEMRKHLTSLSFSEKVEILEKLRDRSLAFAAAGWRNHGVDQSSPARGSCRCSDWEPCACAHQPPYHCMWCCRELTADQLASARERGFYLKEKD
jgi:hypothetical protein